MRKSIAVFLAAVALAAGATAGYLHFSTRSKPAVPAPADVQLPDLEGQLRSLDHWAGQVRVVNFWAPWCAPCRRELPELAALQRQYANQGLVVVGITLDTAQNTRDFALAGNITYPLLVAEQTGMAVARRFGNTTDGVPFTAILDRSGRIVYTHSGALSLSDAVIAIKPLL